jgi:hypothetical protein
VGISLPRIEFAPPIHPAISPTDRSLCGKLILSNHNRLTPRTDVPDDKYRTGG